MQPRTPWKDIFTSVPFWAILVAHTCNNWGFYTLLTTMPMYMKKVLKFNISSVSIPFHKTTVFLFVRLRFTFKNFKVRQSEKKYKNENRTWIKIYVILDKSLKINTNFCEVLMQEISEFFLWHFITFHLLFGFLAHLVYQPKSLIQSCFVRHCHCISISIVIIICAHTPDTWLDIETSYLVHICTYVSHICTSNI